jgi:hypothetical protein
LQEVADRVSIDGGQESIAGAFGDDIGTPQYPYQYKKNWNELLWLGGTEIDKIGPTS